MLREVCLILAPGVNYNLLTPVTNTEYKDLLNIILKGSMEADYDTNIKIFETVFKYINDSKRFM